MKFYLGVSSEGDGSRLTTVFVGHDDGDWQDQRPLLKKYSLVADDLGGFEWGRACGGAHRLALSILADCMGDVAALRFYKTFGDEVVAKIPAGISFKLTEGQVKETVGHFLLDKVIEEHDAQDRTEAQKPVDSDG